MDNSNSKGPIFGAIALLIIVGLFAGIFLFGENEPESPPIAARKTSVVDSDLNSVDKPDITDTQPTANPAPEAVPAASEEQPENPVVAKPVHAMFEAVISGVTIDYFDDPASDITVTLINQQFKPVPLDMAVVSNADGEFTINCEVVAGGEYFVACLMEDYAISVSGAFTVEEGMPVEGLKLKVYAAARVFGKVLNGEDKEPLAAVKINIEGRNNAAADRIGKLLGLSKEGLSDEQGKYEINRLPPGKYLAHATKAGWASNELNPTTRSIQEFEVDEYGNLELLPFVLGQAGIIEGRVLTKKDNKPISGATVTLGTVLGGTFEVTITDQAGEYRFENAPPTMRGMGPGRELGRLTVRATAAGYAIGSRDVSVNSGQTKSGVDIKLTDGVVIKGTVRNQKSEPVSGAKVYLNDTQFLQGEEMILGLGMPDRAVSTTTNEAGQYTLNGVPAGNASVGVQADNYARAEQTVAAVLGEDAIADFTLEPAARIEGIIFDENGSPVAGVPVAAWEAESPEQLGFIMGSFFGESLPDRGDSTMFPTNILSDSEGRFVIDQLKAKEYMLLANSPKHEKYLSDPIKLKTGETKQIEIILIKGARIYGHVLDSDNNGIPGQPITVAAMSDTSIDIRTAITDSQGYYEVNGLKAGTYTVVINDGDPTQFLFPKPNSKVTVPAGGNVKHDILESAPGTARVYGRVTIDGKALANNAVVLAGGSLGAFTTMDAKTDDNGNYEFTGVPLGSYQLSKRRSGSMPIPDMVRKRVHVGREGDIEINIDFQTVSISGKVQLEDGSVPKGNVTVIISPVNASSADKTAEDDSMSYAEQLIWQETTADKDTGAFEIKELNPGFYRLTVRSTTEGMISRPYLNLRARLTGLVITLPGDGASLSGTVTGLDDAKPNMGPRLLGALSIEDETGTPIALGGFDNGVDLTDSKKFTVESLADGVYTVTLSVTGYAPITHKDVTLKTGEVMPLTFAFATSGNAKIKLTNAELELAQMIELEYEIRGSNGEIFKKRFTFLDFFQTGDVAQGEDNTFVIKDLPPDTYTITLNLPGYKQAKEAFTVIAGDTVEVPVEFEKE
ncbi:MAG: carboxypeptidase regulatory-like domain-containing protein [Planctomycetes bacterium]|nr:carboxypeptidase regulatory-like domain-containing protein [Planctomycetota bacterium]